MVWQLFRIAKIVIFSHKNYKIQRNWYLTIFKAEEVKIKPNTMNSIRKPINFKIENQILKDRLQSF